MRLALWDWAGELRYDLSPIDFTCGDHFFRTRMLFASRLQIIGVKRLVDDKRIAVDFPRRASSPLRCFAGPTTSRCVLAESSAKILAPLADLPAGSSELPEVAQTVRPRSWRKRPAADGVTVSLSENR